MVSCWDLLVHDNAVAALAVGPAGTEDPQPAPLNPLHSKTGRSHPLWVGRARSGAGPEIGLGERCLVRGQGPAPAMRV